MKIGFIGLGVMGRPMALNLLAAGYAVTVYARREAVQHEMKEKGAVVADSPQAVAASSEVVITMLPDSLQVREVVLGAQGVLKGAAPGSILMDMSSIAPQTIRDVERDAAKQGVAVLDAPVSGGEAKAIRGELSIMVGGSLEAFEKVRPVLQVLGASVVRIGDVGSGNAAKLVNQVMVGVHIAAMAEAMTLAKKAGLDPLVVFNAIRGGSAGSAVLENKLPKVLARNFKPGFRLELHHKDLMNALGTGVEMEAPMPMTRAVLGIMDQLLEEGEGDMDHTALVHYFETLAKTTLS